MKKANNPPDEYKVFVTEIKKRIRNAQYAALKSVNKELIGLYWDIGKMIVEKQERLGWRKSIVETLANDLHFEFPGIDGFSSRNLWNMRNFYLLYVDFPKLQPVAAEISWTKNIIILEKCKNPEEKEFYLFNTRKFIWTKKTLLQQIKNKTYQKYLHNQTNFFQVLPETQRKPAKEAVKDNYTFDFLQIKDEHSEKELQSALIENIRKFLLELGKGMPSLEANTGWKLQAMNILLICCFFTGN